MDSQHWQHRLSDYLDGELAARERVELEAHLRGCSDCADSLERLRALVAAAAELPPVAPERDLWPGIADRLTPRSRPGASAPAVSRSAERARRRIVLTVPQLAAAALAIVVLSASGVWLAVGRFGIPAGEATASAAREAPAAVRFATAYDETVTELEREFHERRTELDPSTILVVERNLAIIDQAIAEARQALEADPSSSFLNSYLTDTMRRKADLLRQAALIQRTEI